MTSPKADLDKATNQPQPAALPKALCTALGLNDDATADQAAAKAAELAKAATVDLACVRAPRGPEQALNRAGTAEGELREIKAKAHEAEIEAAVNQAQAEESSPRLPGTSTWPCAAPRALRRSSEACGVRAQGHRQP